MCKWLVNKLEQLFILFIIISACGACNTDKEKHLRCRKDIPPQQKVVSCNNRPLNSIIVIGFLLNQGS